MVVSATIPIGFCRGARHQNSLVLVKFEKQTDGTRRRRRRANPDVESRFSKEQLHGHYTIPTNESAAGGVAVKLAAY